MMQRRKRERKPSLKVREMQEAESYLEDGQPAAKHNIILSNISQPWGIYSMNTLFLKPSELAIQMCKLYG